MILTDISSGILSIVFNRPEKKNALTAEMYVALAQHIADAEQNPAVRVVMFYGAEGAFTAGNDLEDFLKYPPTGPESPPFRFLRALANMTKPVMAAVNGVAIGIGTTMLFHCDMVYASTTAKFAFPFINLGVVPEGGASLLLPKLVGHQRASELLMFGEVFKAQDACEFGLVNKVVEDLSVVEYTRQQALRLAALPTGAVRATKGLLRGRTADAAQSGLLGEVLERIDAEANLFAKHVNSPAAREAFDAFFAKRKPNFEGLG